MNSAASTAPAAMAAGRLRFADADDADVLAGPAGRPERCWAALRRDCVPTGGRRGTPDGSVPMVIRPGSRRGGAGGTSPVPGRTSGSEMLSERTSPVGSRSTRPLGSPVGSPVTSSRQTGDSVVNDDQTSTSSSSPSAAERRRRHPRDLPGRRVGPVRQRTGVVGAEAEAPIAGVVGAIGGLVGEERAAELLRRVALLLPLCATCRRSSGLPCHHRHEALQRAVEVRPRAARSPCGPAPRRSPRRDRG